jgi:hypothetical protein
MLHLSRTGHYVTGLLLVAVITIEVGGWLMARIIAGRVPVTHFQKSFPRASHGDRPFPDSCALFTSP